MHVFKNIILGYTLFLSGLFPTSFCDIGFPEQ